MWQSIKNEEYVAQIQRDIINILYYLSLNNQMKLHPDKCKVVTFNYRPSPLAMLTFVPSKKLLSYFPVGRKKASGGKTGLRKLSTRGWQDQFNSG